MNWRFFWEYSRGNVFENMIHQVIFWYKVLELNIPRSVTMGAGNYLSPEMEVPDTYDVAMDHGTLLFTWNSMFGNRYFGEGHDIVLGTKGAISRDDADRVRYLSESSKSERTRDGRPTAKDAPDIVGGSDATDLHLRNFFDCVRSRTQPN